MATRAFGEVAREEVEEGLHFGVKRLRWGSFNHLEDRGEGVTGTHFPSLGILDGVDERGELIAHGLRGDTSGGRLEIDVGRAAYAGVEGVASGHEGVGHGAR